MPDQIIRVEPGILQGRITPPPSKSDAHRAMICCRLSGQTQPPAGLGKIWSDDIKTTWNCLDLLLNNDASDPVELDCGESGTTLRLLVPLAAALNKSIIFTGHGRLPERPIQEYIDIMRGHGVEHARPEKYSLPFSTCGQLEAGVFYAPGNVSSQYISGMLLALPLLEGDSELRLTSKLESAPYVDMTIETMSKFGVDVQRTEWGWSIRGGQSYSPADYIVEADYSQAAFWLTAKYSGSRLDIDGLVTESVQGDRAIINLLTDFASDKTAFEIDVSQIPDLVPILAVAASLTPAVTRLVNGSRLRLKESDRLSSTEDALSRIGADIQQTEDGLIIQGGKPLTGGSASSHNDHRIAMALAIAALSTQEGIEIKGAQAVNKSYPDFFVRMRELGGKCHELNLG